MRPPNRNRPCLDTSDNPAKHDCAAAENALGAATQGNAEIWKLLRAQEGRDYRFYDFERCRQAYRYDPVFAAVVDSLRNLIETMHLTPAEVRSIGVFAATVVEERREIQHYTAVLKEDQSGFGEPEV